MKEKLAKLTELLLDTGKRNNLINFRDNKSNTLEIVFPDFNSVFKKADGNVVLEVFDPQISQDVKENLKKCLPTKSDTSINIPKN